jgi:hypothetical protein
VWLGFDGGVEQRVNKAVGQRQRGGQHHHPNRHTDHTDDVLRGAAAQVA